MGFEVEFGFGVLVAEGEVVGGPGFAVWAGGADVHEVCFEGVEDEGGAPAVEEFAVLVEGGEMGV